MYSYNVYLESIDVDVLCSPEQVDRAQEVIEKRCGWIPTTKQLPDSSWIRYGKLLPNTQDAWIYLDLLTTQYKNLFHEDRSKSLPYDICFEAGMSEIKNIEGQDFKVPIKELLIAYKLKAYRDRTFDMLKERNIEHREHYRSKRTKDISDVIALIDPDYGPIDTEILIKIIVRFEIQIFLETIRNIQTETEAISQYRNRNYPIIRPWIERIVADLSYGLRKSTED